MSEVGLLFGTKGLYPEAEPLMRKALAIQERLSSGNSSEVGISLNNLRDLHNLALLLISMGRTGEAEPLVRQSLEIMRAVHGETHPRPARVMQVLAGVLQGQGQTADAERLLRQALEIFEGILGPDHPSTQSARKDLSRLTAA